MMLAAKVRLAAAVAIAVGAGVASASALVPPAGQESIGGPDTLQPDGGTATVAATSSDPDGGPAWAVRVYTSKTAQTCPEAGRLSGGSFGRVDAAGRFTALPVEASGSCADLGHALAAFAVDRYPKSTTQGARVVLFGATAPSVQSVSLTTATSKTSLALDHGTFLSVGADDFDGSTLSFTTDAGKTTSYSLTPATTG